MPGQGWSVNYYLTFTEFHSTGQNGFFRRARCGAGHPTHDDLMPLLAIGNVSPRKVLEQRVSGDVVGLAFDLKRNQSMFPLACKEEFPNRSRLRRSQRRNVRPCNKGLSSGPCDADAVWKGVTDAAWRV